MDDIAKWPGENLRDVMAAAERVAVSRGREPASRMVYGAKAP